MSTFEKQLLACIEKNVAAIDRATAEIARLRPKTHAPVCPEPRDGDGVEDGPFLVGYEAGYDDGRERSYGPTAAHEKFLSDRGAQCVRSRVVQGPAKVAQIVAPNACEADPAFMARLHRAAANVKPMTPEVAAAYASGPEVSGDTENNASPAMVEIGRAPVNLAKARKAHQRLVDVAFRNRDRETGEPIRAHFEIPPNENDDDIIVSRALDELEALRAAAPMPGATHAGFCPTANGEDESWCTCDSTDKRSAGT